MKRINSQSGFGHIELIVAVLFIGVIAFVGARVLSSSKAASNLTWAPPSGYQNYAVKNVTAQVGTQTINAGGNDVLVKLPKTPTGPINLTNCHNVVIMGGQINLPPNSGPGADMRGIYVNGCTGTVHIEGVLINGDIATAEGDGIAIKAPQAIVQIENVRINKLYGGYNTATHNHSDIIQPWGGVKELRVENLTGSSNYQGFQINDDQGHIGKVTIKNTNIGDSGVPSADGKGGYYLWLKCGTGTSYNFENFYLNPRSGRSLSSSIWDGGCGLNVSNTVATFSNATGSVIGGKPTVDFAPANVGVSYVSPWNGGTTSSSGSTTGGTTGGTTSGGSTSGGTTSGGSTSGGSTGGSTTPPPPTPAPTGPVTVLSDSFSATSTPMTAVFGGWTVGNGVYSISTVKSNLETNSNLSIYPKAVGDNYTLSADAKVIGTNEIYDDFSIIFGYQNSASYYYVSFNETNDNGTNGFFKSVNGTKTQLKNFTPVIKTDTYYKIKVVKTGDTYTVYLDGTNVGSVTDSTFGAGSVGFGSRNNAAVFDNLLVTRP